MPVTKCFVKYHKAILERHTCGLKLGEYLGSGVWGSVFSSSDPKLVVKITKDMDEAWASERVMEFRRDGLLLPGLVEILHVSEIEELEDDGEILYSVVRERIVPANDAGLDKWMWTQLDRILYIIGHKQAYSASELLEAHRFLMRHAPHLEQSVCELTSIGYDLIDLDISNIGLTMRPRLGVSEGTFVMFDISFGQEGAISTPATGSVKKYKDK